MTFSYGISSQRRQERFDPSATEEEFIASSVRRAQEAFDRANGADRFSPRDIGVAATPVTYTDADGNLRRRHPDEVEAEIVAATERLTEAAIAAGVYNIWTGKVRWADVGVLEIPAPIPEVQG